MYLVSETKTIACETCSRPRSRGSNLGIPELQAGMLITLLRNGTSLESSQ